MGVGGRNSKLTAKSAKTILAGIRAGLPVKLAALKAGVTEGTVYCWTRTGRADGAEPAYSKFSNDYQLAIVAAYERRVKRIEKHGKRDWRADAWWIERMYPDLMGSDAKTIRELKAMIEKLMEGKA